MMYLKYKGANMQNIWKPFLLLFIIAQESLAKEYCLDKSYQSAIGMNEKNIKKIRKEELDYSDLSDPNCCCSAQIKGLFQESTKDMMDIRLNPATDNLIKALRNQRMASDIKIEELVHLKYVLAMYSFYNEDGKKMGTEKLTMPDEDGCIGTITFRKLEKKDLERKGVRREGILKDILSILHAWGKSDKMIAEKNMIKMVK